MGKNPVLYLTKKVARENGVNLDKYPSFHASGSIPGMRKVYGPYCDLVRQGQYIYNVPRWVYLLAKKL